MSKNVKELTKILIKAGADINQKDHQGYTALAYAIYYNMYETQRLLQKAGAILQDNYKIAVCTILRFSLSLVVSIMSIRPTRLILELDFP